MDEKYEFCVDAGYFYNGDYLSDFEPMVVKVVQIIDKANGIRRMKYVVAVRNIHGVMLEEKEVDSLKNIPYFELWECPDSLLTGKQKKLLENKLQKDVLGAQRETEYLCPQGVQEEGGNLFMVFGDVIVGEPQLDGVIRINEPRKLKGKSSDYVLLGEASKRFIMLIPGVTEMLFYGAMFAVVRPVLRHLGYKPDFMLALIGPSGHLKQNEKLDILCRHASGEKQCAQIVLTGEKLDNMGIFSCRDRILQIKVPKMTSQELADVKRKLSVTQFEYIPGLMLKFAEALIADQDRLRNDIKDFWTENALADGDKDYSLRIPQHATYLKLTELLYRKYMLKSSEEDSCKKQLFEAGC